MRRDNFCFICLSNTFRLSHLGSRSFSPSQKMQRTPASTPLSPRRKSRGKYSLTTVYHENIFYPTKHTSSTAHLSSHSQRDNLLYSLIYPVASFPQQPPDHRTSHPARHDDNATSKHCSFLPHLL